VQHAHAYAIQGDHYALLTEAIDLSQQRSDVITITHIRMTSISHKQISKPSHIILLLQIYELMNSETT
jgi:hypothetical protein